jgi:putative oxidoreductase
MAAVGREDMKIAALIARILLGLVFLVFGLNGFLLFIPGSNMVPPGLAGQFDLAMMQSHYTQAVSAVEVVAALLLLSGFYVPLGLLLIGPVIVNILFYHIFLFPHGAEPACVVLILWIVVFVRNREHFAGIFVQRTS